MPAHESRTLALSPSWDLTLDENGNPATIEEISAVLQNCANECRLFTNDAYFRFEDGIPWFDDQLAKPINEALVSQRLREACLSVEGVLSVRSVEIIELDAKTRTLHARIQLETEEVPNAQLVI